MKLNNLDDFTKNNWYITTSPASTIHTDTNPNLNQLKEPQNHHLLVQTNPIQIVDNNINNLNNSIINNYRHQVSIEEIPSTTITQECQQSERIEEKSEDENLVSGLSFKDNKMPATTAITTSSTATPIITTSSQADVLAVEELVHEIKENLRLKARPSTQPPQQQQQQQQHHHHQHRYGSRSARPSPYHIPCRSWNDQNQSINTNFNINNINYINTTNENHLTCNSFINKNSLHHNYHHHHHHNHKKEQDIDDPYELLQTLLKSKNLVKEAVRRLQLNSISPKQRSYFYESDDESRSPMFRMCQLEM